MRRALGQHRSALWRGNGPSRVVKGENVCHLLLRSKMQRSKCNACYDLETNIYKCGSWEYNVYNKHPQHLYNHSNYLTCADRVKHIISKHLWFHLSKHQQLSTRSAQPHAWHSPVSPWPAGTAGPHGSASRLRNYQVPPGDLQRGRGWSRWKRRQRRKGAWAKRAGFSECTYDIIYIYITTHTYIYTYIYHYIIIYLCICVDGSVEAPGHCKING